MTTDWVKDLKKRNDSKVEGNIVSDPKFGDLEIGFLGGAIQYIATDKENSFTLMPRRYTGKVRPEKPSELDWSKESGQWRLVTAGCTLDGVELVAHGNTPSETMEAMILKAERLSVMAANYAERIKSQVSKLESLKKEE